MKKALKVTGIVLVVLFIIGLLSPSDKKQDTLLESKPDQIQETDVAATTTPLNHPGPDYLENTPSPPARSSRSMTIETMKNNFNTFASNNNLDFRIDDITISEGEVNNTFSYTFGKNIAWIGTLNKTDNSIKELTMICAGEGSSGLDIMLMMGCLIATADPSLAAEERGEILKSLHLMDGERIRGGIEEHVVNNRIKYWINVGGGIGVWFGASLEG